MMSNTTVFIILFAVSFCNASSWWSSSEFMVIQRMFDDCAKGQSDPSHCLKNKAVAAVERAVLKNITLFNGVSLVKNNNENVEGFVQNLETDPDKRFSRALKKFAETHTVKVDFSDVDSSFDDETGVEMRGHIEEIHKKKAAKKSAPFYVMALLILSGFVGPLAIKTLALIAGHALLASKLALLIAGMVTLRKLFADDKHEHESTSFQVHTVPDKIEDRVYFQGFHPNDPYRGYRNL